MRTTHEDSFKGRDREDFVSVFEEDSRGRFIYCRVCQRGNSPADYELDDDIFRDVISKYPQVVGDADLGDDAAMKFLKAKVVEGHDARYEEYQDPRALGVLFERRFNSSKP